MDAREGGEAVVGEDGVISGVCLFNLIPQCSDLFSFDFLCLFTVVLYRHTSDMGSVTSPAEAGTSILPMIFPRSNFFVSEAVVGERRC